jgi:hypothetical protein
MIVVAIPAPVAQVFATVFTGVAHFAAIFAIGAAHVARIVGPPNVAAVIALGVANLAVVFAIGLTRVVLRHGGHCGDGDRRDQRGKHRGTHDCFLRR